jgi:hypothetical protein
MPAPIGASHFGRDIEEGGWHRTWFSGVNLGRKLYFLRTSAVFDALEQGGRAGIMRAKRPTGSGALRKGIRWTALFACFRSYRG